MGKVKYWIGLFILVGVPLFYIIYGIGWSQFLYGVVLLVGLLVFAGLIIYLIVKIRE